MSILHEHDWYDHWIPQYLNDVAASTECFDEGKVVEYKENRISIHVSQDSIEYIRIGNLIKIKEYYNRTKTVSHSEKF